jgi:Flp pilus assembly protein TadG
MAARWRTGLSEVADGAPRRAVAQAIAEFAVASAVFLSMMVAVIDLALWLDAQNVVLSASQEAATVGSRENASAEEAVIAARRLLQAGLGSTAVAIDTVNVNIGPDVTTAEVSGTWYVAPLGPLVPVPLHARASMLREQFRPGGR